MIPLYYCYIFVAFFGDVKLCVLENQQQSQDNVISLDANRAGPVTRKPDKRKAA